MQDSLFSHPVETEYVAPKNEDSAEPVKNPVFSDQQK
jgi:hypothetical protein